MIRRALTLVAVDGGIGKMRMRGILIGKQDAGNSHREAGCGAFAFKKSDEEHSHLKSQMRSILNQECTVADK